MDEMDQKALVETASAATEGFTGVDRGTSSSWELARIASVSLEVLEWLLRRENEILKRLAEEPQSIERVIFEKRELLHLWKEYKLLARCIAVKTLAAVPRDESGMNKCQKSCAQKRHLGLRIKRSWYNEPEVLCIVDQKRVLEFRSQHSSNISKLIEFHSLLGIQVLSNCVLRFAFQTKNQRLFRSSTSLKEKVLLFQLESEEALSICRNSIDESLSKLSFRDRYLQLSTDSSFLSSSHLDLNIVLQQKYQQVGRDFCLQLYSIWEYDSTKEWILINGKSRADILVLLSEYFTFCLKALLALGYQVSLGFINVESREGRTIIYELSSQIHMFWCLKRLDEERNDSPIASLLEKLAEFPTYEELEMHEKTQYREDALEFVDVLHLLGFSIFETKRSRFLLMSKTRSTSCRESLLSCLDV